MDSRSHIEFAKKLLPENMAEAVPASLFPQIDRQPAVLHRNYAHHINKTKPIVERGMELLFSDRNMPEEDYVGYRFCQERSRILEYTPEVKAPKKMDDEFKQAAHTAFVSHLYLDTFNQPVQAFTPFKANCAVQLEMWDKVGDFRYRLYVDKVVEELRKDWLKSSVWTDEFSTRDHLCSMVRRLAELADVPVKSTPVKQACESLGISSELPNTRAYSWMLDMEHDLCELHVKYLG